MLTLRLENGVGIAGLAYAAAGDTAPADDGRLARLPVFTQLGVRAALGALGDLPAAERLETAVVAGSSHGPIEAMHEFVSGFRARGHARGNPLLFPNVLHNAVAGEVATRAHLHGPNLTLAAGELAASGVLEAALLLLAAGRARRVLALTVDDAGPLMRRICARLRRRGLGQTQALARLLPDEHDTAVALLLDPQQAGRRRLRRAHTGHAPSATAFEDFLHQVAGDLPVAARVELDDSAPISLGRLLAAALGQPPGTRSLVAHRGPGGACGAVVFEN